MKARVVSRLKVLFSDSKRELETDNKKLQADVAKKTEDYRYQSQDYQRELADLKNEIALLKKNTPQKKPPVRAGCFKIFRKFVIVLFR